MQSQWTLSERVNAARAGTPQVVSRCGQPVEVILSTEAYDRLLHQQIAGSNSFKDLLLAMPQKADRQDSNGSS